METLKELDKISADLLTKLPELMQAGTVYANDLMARFVKYIVITNVVEICLIILATIFSCVVNYLIYKNFKQTYVGGDIVITLSTLFWFFFILFLGVETHTSVKDIITVLYVPELFIINYFK